MKWVRYGAAGAERPGIIDGAGVIRDASALVSDWTPARLSAPELARWASVDTSQ